MSESLQERVVKIKVIGVGGAGNNVINRMIESGVDGVEFIAVNTDKQDLNKSVCKNKIQIGEKLTNGMGAGSKPEIGKKSAEESRAAIAKVLEGTDMVFITAGMGGGTGTGAAPIVADLAHEAGILTVGVVTKPFKFEGANRMRQAEEGIANLSEKVDSLIIIPNDRLKYVTDQKITFANAFGIADDVLKQAVTSISELVGFSENVMINLDFADVSAVMKSAGRAHMGVGSSEMTLDDVETAAGIVQEAANANANIIFGATCSDVFQDEMRVTVIATGFDGSSVSFSPKASAAASAADDIDTPVGAAAKPTKPTDIGDIDEIFSIFKRN